MTETREGAACGEGGVVSERAKSCDDAVNVRLRKRVRLSSEHLKSPKPESGLGLGNNYVKSFKVCSSRSRAGEGVNASHNSFLEREWVCFTRLVPASRRRG